MPWTEKDYPSSWKNLESITRRKAIDMGNAMLKNGYKEDDVIPIVTAKAKEWTENASEADKRDLRKKDITKHEKDESDQGAKYAEKDIHVLYSDEKDRWEIKTAGAKQASEFFDTKKEAEQRAEEIAENRDTDVISHKKSDDEKSAEHTENSVHVQYDNDKEHWEVKTKGAKRVSATFETKKEAEERAKEIADNRDAEVTTHTKEEDMI